MYKGDAKKIRANYSGNSVKSMNLSVEASLKKLQTNYSQSVATLWCSCLIWLQLTFCISTGGGFYAHHLLYIS